MLKANSILKNTTFLMGGNLAQRILSFITAIIITRYLGPERYGEYTFVIALVLIMEILWNFGLGPVLVRDVSRNNILASGYAGGMILTRFVLLFLIFPFILLYLKILNYSDSIVFATVIFVLGRFIMSVNNIFESIFAAFKKMQYTSLMHFLFSLSLLIGIIFMTQFSGDVLHVFLCYLFAFVVAFIYASVVVKKKFVKPAYHFKFDRIIKFVKLGTPFLLINFTYIIFHKVDHLMISGLINETELGFYGSAYTLFEIVITFFPITIINAAFPVLSEYYNRDINLMKSVFNVLMKLFLFIGIPISIGFILLGPQIITAFYGNAYNSAGPILSVLGGSIGVFFIVALISWTLTAANRQKEVLFCTFIAMIINVVLNLFFIPKWGGIGAAWTTLISEIVNGILVYWILFDQIKVKFDVNLGKILAGSILMSVLIIILNKYNLFPNIIVQLIAVIISAAVLYFIVAFSLKTISWKELKFLSSN